MSLVVISLIIISLTIITGCSSSSSQPKLPPYKIIFDTTSDMNNFAPLKMHVLLLKSREEFMSAEFFSLQRKDKAALGDKLVNENQFFLRPSRSTYCVIEKNQSEANYIGVIAEYSQLSGKKWRIAFPVPLPPEKPSFYEFWRSSPDELNVCVKVTHNGLSSIQKCNLSCTAETEENNE
ncbi:type VI secretion system lipoprotein TssJ [Xenorhabdus santafensis]|nr:type VI secretion system lipoprotein TssJ [Xenorhabdus sp. 12]